jgi:enoyl-CoA hydratase/carnithine racemase
MDAARLVLSVADGVGWIVIDNEAKRNAMSGEMFRSLSETAAAWADDPAVRVVVVRGAGDRAFVSGGDIGQMRTGSVPHPGDDRSPRPVAGGLGGLDKPVIALIHGYCLGGGVAVAMAADIRYCSDDAQFGIPAARLGVAYPYEDTARLVSLVGAGHAAEILFAGARIGASEALRIGLVNRVVPKDELEPAVRALAATIASGAPLSHVAHKRSIRTAATAAVRGTVDGTAGGADDRAAIDHAIAAAWASDDFTEGRTAFLEHREARFAGR